MIYGISFIAGFEETVRQILEKRKIKISLLESGFCLVEIEPEDVIAKLRFPSKVYRVLQVANDLSGLDLTKKIDCAINGRTFNLRFFDGSRPAVLDQDVKETIINRVSEDTNLKLSSFNPDEDFVLLLRKSGVFIFGIKLKALDKISNKKVRAGALHSDVAYLLCEFLGLRSGAKVLECFAGYGGISEIILENFNPAKFRLVEKESGLVNELKLKFKECQNYKVVAGEAVKYLRKNNEEFDFIIADPPWGEYDSTVKIAELYADFLEAAKLRLSSDGKILIFSSAKDVLESAVKKLGLKIEKRADVLISGKKVLVFSLC